MFGRGHGAGGGSPQFLGHRGAVGLDDELSQDACMFVLTGQHIEQRRPQRRVATEPVENVAIEQLMVEQSCGGTMQAVLAVIPVAKAVWGCQRPMPGVPNAAILILDVKIDGNLADIVKQRRVGDGRRPDF